MNIYNNENIDRSFSSKMRMFKNRFGHFRAGWRIFFYISFVIVLFKLLDLLGNSFLLIRGENLNDYALLLNRFISKFSALLSVLIPGLVLLKWVDKRPVNLLGIGYYKGAVRDLARGMLMGFIIVTFSVLILALTGWASYSFDGFSMDILLYLLSCLIVAIISAAYEEVLFRGYIFQSLIEGSNFWITLVIYSLLFGAAHIGNAKATVFSVTFAVIAGVFLGVIYFKTRTLWTCIGVHFMWNWTMAPLFGMGVDESKFLSRSLFSYKPSDSVLIIGTDAVSEIILGIIVIAVTIYLWRAKWLRPVESNRKLWAAYPPKYGTDPEMSA